MAFHLEKIPTLWIARRQHNVQVFLEVSGIEIRLKSVL